MYSFCSAEAPVKWMKRQATEGEKSLQTTHLIKDPYLQYLDNSQNSMVSHMIQWLYVEN